ncbi:TPA_asm: coat protein [ssRNA phage SRR7976325_19]|uniref:Coat protein n=1 Tax=ssRNA phage SRR7976325_19 TaxID=2786706 RepID=A0A8S5L518_9VIRU|nr:coat protein [ssRNA phage SRR7976325_19]DAD52792.1 TPA_asm: coat protein [ssRNA phage SRR7976325_19]
MATITNITVKKADGTTDIVYTAIQPASGDGQFAAWRQEDLSVPSALRPVLKMKCTDNGPKTARKPHLEYSYPFTYTDSTTGLKMTAHVVLSSADYLVPTSVPDAIIAEAVHQFTNLQVSPAIRDSIKAGITPV